MQGRGTVEEGQEAMTAAAPCPSAVLMAKATTQRYLDHIAPKDVIEAMQNRAWAA